MAMDPVRVADVLLAVTLRARADAVLLDLGPPTFDAHYNVTVERDQRVLATFTLDAPTASATIARLAYIAELDLATPQVASAVVELRSGHRTGEVLITIRPGRELRAELTTIHKRRTQPRAGERSPLGPGRVVGKFRIISELGQGGMGTVFRVEHVVLGRQFALKVVRAAALEGSPTAAPRFLREARAAARVRHPNIVDVFDFGYVGGRPYYVMELIEGQSLDALIGQRGMPPTIAVAVAKQMAEALATVHDHGVVHADVTPSNTLVVSTEPVVVKLTDFGLAAITGEAAMQDDPNVILGTPAFVSPELLRGLPPSDRSDQYALGAVMFKMLTGHPPYEHSNVRELCMMHLNAAIPAVTSPYGPLPPKLADVVVTCLQKSPQSRFPGMRALLAALDDVEQITERRGWRRWLAT